ncbi:MAG: LamG domain-containing protein, partial [Campylobacterales bacterium]
MRIIRQGLAALGLWVLTLPAMADISTGLLAHYGLEGNTLDSGLYSHDGTVYGTPDYAAGVIGQAISFDGLGDYVTVPVMYENNVSELTFSGWFYIDAGKPQQTLFANGEGGEIYAEYNSGSLLFSANTINDSWQTLIVGGVPVNTWSHLAFVYRKGVGLEVWIDGVQSGALPLNDSLLYNPSGWHSHIGAYNGNSDSSSMQGMVDDFRIHARALSAIDIQELRCLPTGGYWYSVGGAAPACQGSPLTFDAYRAVSLNGGSQFGYAVDFAGLNTLEHTINVSFMSDDVYAAGAKAIISRSAGNYDASYPGKHQYLLYVEGGYLYYRIGDGAVNTVLSTPVESGVVYNVTAKSHGTQMSLFLNGTQVGTAPING